MSRPTAWLVHAAALLAGATGLVYGWMRYLVVPEDEFAVVNHPWQPDAQHLHVVVVPLLVFAVGAIWCAHVWPRLRGGARPRRWTGWLLAVALAPMVASGYLLQVSTDDAWRAVWIWTHAVTSTLWIACYLVHQLLPPPRPRRRG